MKNNYQLMLDKELALLKSAEKTPRLLLHTCCAPCASYVLEYLTEYFDITVFFMNPNITDGAEYKKRADELLRLISEMPAKNKIETVICPHDADSFYRMTDGLEDAPEGGIRCFGCYRQRLEATAAYMKDRADMFDYFATTLTVSPHKNADKLNEIGLELSEKYGIRYLVSDFKKKNGYKRSIELSAKYDLYRQNFCGCEYSKR